MSEKDTIERYFKLLFDGAAKLVAQGKRHAPMLNTVKANGDSPMVVTDGWPDDAVREFVQDTVERRDVVCRKGPAL